MPSVELEFNPMDVKPEWMIEHTKATEEKA